MTRSATTVVIDEIEAGLRGLAATAPDTLATATLDAVGLSDSYATTPSPLGDLVVAWNRHGVSAVSLADQPGGLQAFEVRHRATTGRPARRVEALPDRLAEAIARRLAGDRRARVDLDLRGHGEFERQVWLKALEIPAGEVRTYSWIAAEIGRPRAVRAVGTALGRNPVPLVVPCHRVVRSDGTIGQYSLGGPRNKRTILASEGLDPDELEAGARAGVRLVGSDTTKIVCHPTCRHARRIQAHHRVPFRSLGDARRAGYRPCLTCRPAAPVAA